MATRLSPFVFALMGLVLAYVLLALYFVFFGRINEDEGWYLYAAHRVYQGEVPYQDFAFFQTPFLSYVYGLPQLVFGQSVEAGRLTSFSLSLITVSLGARLAYEQGGRLAPLLFIPMLFLTPLALWASTSVRTEPLTAPLLMLTAHCLARSEARPRDAAIALAAILLGVAVRASLAPAAICVAAWVAYRHRHSLRDLALVFLPACIIAMAFLIFVLSAGLEAAWFNIVTAQVNRHDQLQQMDAWTFIETLRAKSFNLSSLATQYGFVATLSFATVAAALFVLVQRARGGGSATNRLTGGAGIALLAAIAYAPQLTPRAVDYAYFASVFPIFCVAIASWTGLLFNDASPDAKKIVLASAAGLLLLQSTVLAAQFETHSKRSNSDLSEVDSVATYLRGNLPEDGELLTMDAFLAVEAGLSLSPGFEMSVFSYFPRRKEDDGQKYHILTDAKLEEAFANADGIALTDTALGILINKRLNGYAPVRVLSEAELRRVLPGLDRFHLARVYQAFGQFEDNLYILLPASASAG